MKQHFMICKTSELIRVQSFFDPVVGDIGGCSYNKSALVPEKVYKTLKGAEGWLSKKREKELYIVIPFYCF